MQHNDATKLVSRLLQHLKINFGFRLMFGAEVEFYLFDHTNATNNNNDYLYPKILTTAQLLELSNTINMNITAERGVGQYEFRTEPLEDITTIINLIYNIIFRIKSFALSHGLFADFRPKPIATDYGSALHIHTSLHTANSYNLANNLYAECQLPPQTAYQNNLLALSIAGVLKILNQSMYILTDEANPEHIKRFIPGFMTPLNLSWGFNNRTTAIRIPNSSIVHRRFEFRVAGANIDVTYALLVVVTGILLGLKTKPTLPPPIYGNAYDDHYTNVENICTDTNMIYSNFSLPIVANSFLSSYDL